MLLNGYKNVQMITHRTQRQIADSLIERSNSTDEAETPGFRADNGQTGSRMAGIHCIVHACGILPGPGQGEGFRGRAYVYR
jgi:hypothetical protein